MQGYQKLNGQDRKMTDKRVLRQVERVMRVIRDIVGNRVTINPDRCSQVSCYYGNLVFNGCYKVDKGPETTADAKTLVDQHFQLIRKKKKFRRYGDMVIYVGIFFFWYEFGCCVTQTTALVYAPVEENKVAPSAEDKKIPADSLENNLLNPDDPSDQLLLALVKHELDGLGMDVRNYTACPRCKRIDKFESCFKCEICSHFIVALGEKLCARKNK